MTFFEAARSIRYTAIHGVLAAAIVAVLGGCGGAATTNGATSSTAPPDSSSIPPPSPPPSPPLPLPSTGKSIVRIEDRSGTTRADVPVTFGHVFKRGDVPAGRFLQGRTGTGTVIPVQADVKATHADGSLRHAVITAVVPSLNAGGSESIELLPTTTAPPTGSVSANDLLQTAFNAVVTLNVNGVAYQASARDLLSADSSRTWLAGPYATEWVVTGPVRTGGATAHPHLAVRFNIRAYAGLQRVRVDIAVENNWTFVANAGNVTYNATITVGGSQAFTQSNLRHNHHSRWRKVYWWGADPRVHVAHDVAYLIETGAVPNYDRSIVMSQSTLTSEAAQWAAAPTGPGQVGLLDPFMPATGGRQDIGPLPRFAARYVLSMDERAKASTLGSGDLSGSWPIHLRDEQTGYPVSIATNPDIYWDDLPGTGAATSFTPDTAHQPSIAYLPYVVTGDEYYLEELQFWATWNWVSYHPTQRNRGAGIIGGGQQTRAHAWMLRTLGHTAYITPDSHPLKNYFVARLGNAIDWYNANFTNNPSANRLGWMSGYAATGVYDPVWSSFEDDFFTQTVGWLRDMGFAVDSLLFWKARYSVGLMTDGGFCHILATAYRKVVGSGGTYFTTFAQMYVPTLQQAENGYSAVVGLGCDTPAMAAALGQRQGEMVNDFWPYSYPSVLYGALAAAVDIGYPNAEAAFDRLVARANPVSGPEKYTFDPTFALVPRTVAKRVLP